MGLFKRKEQNMEETEPNKTIQRTVIRSVTRVEPVVYTRLGEGGLDVPSDILLKTVERLSKDEPVFNDETLPAIAEFLVSHNYAYRIAVNNITTRYDVVNLKRAEDLLESIKKTVEAAKAENTCVYTCPICKIPHFITAADFKAVMNVTVGKSVSVDFSFHYSPKHETVTNEELTEVQKFETLHRMQRTKMRLDMTESDAITAVADFIYRHTGIKNDSMIINGEQYSEYLNGIDLNNTTYSSEEKTSTENEIERVTIKEIRLEGEQLQQTKAELLAEMRIAARYGNYDKASRINNELIPLLEERIRQNDLRMLDAMIREQDGFSLKY